MLLLHLLTQIPQQQQTNSQTHTHSPLLPHEYECVCVRVRVCACMCNYTYKSSYTYTHRHSPIFPILSLSPPLSLSLTHTRTHTRKNNIERILISLMMGFATLFFSFLTSLSHYFMKKCLLACATKSLLWEKMEIEVIDPSSNNSSFVATIQHARMKKTSTVSFWN